ncbi:MAG TPA: DsbA family protein [Solirubrobacteraceae bacterium]
MPASQARISVTHFTDPGCPWAYSAAPALAVLRWRYGAQLQWRLVTIGLTEQAEQYVRRGYTPAGQARGYQRFRRYGMPFAPAPRARVAATARMCRAIHAARLQAPGREEAVFRALQFAQFTTPLVLDEDDAVLAALRDVAGVDPAAVVAALDDPAVTEAYEADRAAARTAAGSPTEFQGKSAQTDGPVRFTAPSLIFERAADGARLEAGGFQPVEAYDVLLANLDGELERAAPPDGPLPALQREPEGLTTAEVAAVLAQGNDAPDRTAAEAALIDLAAEGAARRVAVGDDAVWVAAA